MSDLIASSPRFFHHTEETKQVEVEVNTDSDNGLDLVDVVVARFAPGNHPALKFPMLHPKD